MPTDAHLSTILELLDTMEEYIAAIHPFELGDTKSDDADEG